MKRRSMTLIEMMISLILVSVLLTTLFFWYGRISQKKMSHHQEYRPLLQEYFAFKRLADIFENVTLNASRGKTCFFSSQETDHSSSLIFTFNRGTHPSPDLSDIVLAKLYVQNNDLIMSVWPQPREDRTSTTESPEETILLLKGVTSIDYQFLAPESLHPLVVDPKSVGNTLVSAGWHAQWSPQYKQLPALISCSLKGTHLCHWTFDLHLPVQYSLAPTHSMETG